MAHNKIKVSFGYKGLDYTYDLDIDRDGHNSEVDFWVSFEGVNVIFDIHYCEDYNSICVYKVDKVTLEADYVNVIHRQEIFSEEEYNRIQDENKLIEL